MSRSGKDRRRERRKNRHEPQPDHSADKAKGHRNGRGHGSSNNLARLKKLERQRRGKYKNQSQKKLHEKIKAEKRYLKNYDKIAGFGATSPLRKSHMRFVL